LGIPLGIARGHLQPVFPVQLQHQNHQVGESGDRAVHDRAKRAVQVVRTGQRRGDVFQKLRSISAEVGMPG
jgi:hypothetical protein